MKRQELEQKIKGFIVDIECLSLIEEEIDNDSNFYDDLGLDSLDQIEVVMKIENEFQIVIPDEVGASFKTFKQLVDYVESVIK